MLGPFELFFSSRYLIGAQGQAEGRRFLRFITVVAIGGVTVGVAALILALAIVRGFSREIQDKLFGFGAHVHVESMRDGPLDDAEATLWRLRDMERVVRAEPIIEEFALLRASAELVEGVKIVGVDLLPDYVDSSIVAGSGSLASGRLPTIIVGSGVARQTGVSVSDTVAMFSMRGSGYDGSTSGFGLGKRPRIKQFVVGGVYETDLPQFDDIYVYTDLTTTRSLFDYGPDQVSRFELTLDDVSLADSAAIQISTDFGFPIQARSISQIYQGLFAWVDLQQSIIPLVISIIVLVAVFNIVATLLMTILEKSSELGVLASLGAGSRLIGRVFLTLGLMIGVIGVLLGEIMALALAVVQLRYGVITLPAESYYMTKVPIQLDGLDFVIVAAATILVCVLFAYIPARFAGRIEPVRVLRFR